MSDAKHTATDNVREPVLFDILRLPASVGSEVIPEREKAFQALWQKSSNTIRQSQNTLGETVLHVMAANDFDGLIRQVLTDTPALSAIAMRYNSHNYPIHTAISSGALKAAEALYEADSNTATYVNADGQLPLHLAAQSGTKAMLTLCCEQHTGDIDAVDGEGLTALALLRSRFDLTPDEQKDFEACLLAKGAKEDKINLQGTTRMDF